MNNRILVTKVSGVTFEGRQEYLALLSGKEPCRIVPEPENPYDKNALAVHVAADGDILHVGYIPKALAAEIAPHLDGETLMVTIDEITGGFAFSNGEFAALGLLLRIEIPGEITTRK